MIIDITKLTQQIEKSILVDDDFSLDGSLYKDSDILCLKQLHVKGAISLNEDDDIELNLNVTGVMVIEDSISLDHIDYPFSTIIDEIYEKKETNLINTLDISDILWQNIVLEVPLRFTNVKDYSKFKGEGWRLLSEEDRKSSNNPFENLKDLFREE